LKKIALVLPAVIILTLLVAMLQVQGETFVESRNYVNGIAPANRVYLSTAQDASSSQSENVTVYVWDVGQGDSILISTSQKNVLIDGGTESVGSTLLGYLWSVNVTHLDFVVATHPHEDHIGGLPAVMTSNITVDTVLYNGQTYTTQIYQQFINLAQQHNLTVACRNQFYPLTATANFTILSPTQPFELPDDDANTNSVVLKLQVNNVSLLFTGDATAEAEQNMLDAGLNLQSDVLKVGHHGSKYATSQPFLDAVNPTYAVISVGANNVYGHPHAETIQRLDNKGVITYRTDTSGTIVFITDGTAVMVIPEIYSAAVLIILAVMLMVSLIAFKKSESGYRALNCE
jgi:competence protein ComEC